MKKFLKFIIIIFLLPFIVIFNPYTIKIKNKIISIFNSIIFKISLKKSGKNLSIQRHNRFEGLKNVIIGDNFAALENMWMQTINNYGGKKYNPSITIGNNVTISRFFHIAAIGNILIEDNVLIGSSVLINDHSHGETSDLSLNRGSLPLVSKGNITIGKNTWICDNCVILGGVTIGENSIVAANSVVNKSFPPNSLIAGNPAKLVKYI